MAGHLLRAGHTVTVCSRDSVKNTALAAEGATVAANLTELARAVEAIAICVPRTEDVEATLAGLGPGLRSGLLVVDHSTILPEAAARLHAQLLPEGVHFVDAPITGGSMGAQSGTLTVFMGGTEPDIASVLPWIQAYARRAERVGGPGTGQMMKMVNQIAVGGALIGLCEALAFAAKAGLDLTQAKEMVGSGAAGSWAFDNYGPKILRQDWSPGFSIVNQRKDFGYVEAAAAGLNAAVPMTSLVNDWLGILDRSGRGEATTAALYEALLAAGFTPPTGGVAG